MNHERTIDPVSTTIPAGSPPARRMAYLDIARALVIILVVLYHSPFDHAAYIGWFRMPSFFVLSGLLYRTPARRNVGPFLKKRTFNLLTPYFVYGILLLTIGILKDRLKDTAETRRFDLWSGLPDFFGELSAKAVTLLLGGDWITDSIVSVFWFTNCLYVVILLFTSLRVNVKSDALLVVIVGALYAVGIVLSNRLTVPVPWSFDTACIALTYFTMGFYAQPIVRRVAEHIRTFLPLLLLLLIACGTLVLLSEQGLFTFSFSFRGSTFANPLLTVLVPPVYTATILMLSMLLSRTWLRPYLSYIGKNTLPILFLHMMVGMWIYIICHYFGREPHYLLWTALSLLIPLGFAAVVDQFPLTRSLFLGKGSYELFGQLPSLFTKYIKFEKGRLQS